MSSELALKQYFHGALPGDKLTRFANNILTSNGFTPGNTVFATSTCSDEINRVVTNFGEYWGSAFQLGGLSGYPFTGKSGFSELASHVPHNGNIFIIYGPHVGITKEGTVGRVLRKGSTQETDACGSVVKAYNALKEGGAVSGDKQHDGQQAAVVELVATHIDSLKQLPNPMPELPHVMYETIKKELNAIISPEFKGMVALLGGIQINTPQGESDQFLIKEFKILNHPRHGTIEMKERLKLLYN